MSDQQSLQGDPKSLMMSCMIELDALPEMPLIVAKVLYALRRHWVVFSESSYAKFREDISEWKSISDTRSDGGENTNAAVFNVLDELLRRRAIKLPDWQCPELRNRTYNETNRIDSLEGIIDFCIDETNAASDKLIPMLIPESLGYDEMSASEFKAYVCEPVMRWAKTVTIIDPYLGKAILERQGNADEFIYTVQLIYTAWIQSAAMNKDERKRFTIISSTKSNKGPDAAKEAREIHEVLEKEAHCSRDKLVVELKRRSSDPDKRIHDRYILASYGEAETVCLKVSKGLDLFNRCSGKKGWQGQDCSFSLVKMPVGLKRFMMSASIGAHGKARAGAAYP